MEEIQFFKIKVFFCAMFMTARAHSPMTPAYIENLDDGVPHVHIYSIIF